LTRGSIQKLAVIGPNVRHFRVMGGGSSSLKPHYISAPLSALHERYPGMDVSAQTGCPTFKYIPEPERDLLTPAVEADETFDDAARGLRVQFYADLERTQLIRQRIISQSTVHASLLAGAATAMTLDGEYLCATAGDYTFGLLSTGRARMWVDGDAIIDNWTSPEPGEAFFMQGSSEVRATRFFEAGQRVRILIEYEVSTDTMFKGLRYGILEPQFLDPISEAVTLASTSDACILMVGTNDDWETEGNDRETLSLPGAQDELIARVLAVNPNTVVVNNSGAPISMPWVNQAPAILQCWFPGQEFGRALMDLLFGEVSPSGRLPLTFPKRIEDVPAFAHYPGNNGQVRYEEGLNIGYRGFYAAKTEPLFAFGHGLSYTEFDYSEVHAELNDAEAVVLVSLSVTNTGIVTGQEVVQAYLCFPDSLVNRPAISLAGFTKVTIAPGSVAHVTLSLPLARFKYWDTSSKSFQLETGACTIEVGSSARDLKLSASLLLN